MKYPLAPNGVFWTLQGEGALQGEPMAFVRLAGCSIGCPQCDTDYSVSKRLTPEEILAAVRAVVPPTFLSPWVWITGGEPTDHDIAPLMDLLRTVGFRVAIATAGTRTLPPKCADWISVSPHGTGLMQRYGSEIKVVPGLNGAQWKNIVEWGGCSFAYRFIQPLAGSAESVVECTEFVLANPGWRLTNQAHKQWGLP